MNLAQAKETARKINGQEVPIAYRNVWGFFPPDEEDAPKPPIVLITKDGSNPPRQGVFLDDGKRMVSLTMKPEKKSKCVKCLAKPFSTMIHL